MPLLKKKETEDPKNAEKENKKKEEKKEKTDRAGIIGDKKIAELGSEKLKSRDRKIRAMKIALLIVIMFLIIIYFLLRLFFTGGAFTVALDSSLDRDHGLIMYESIQNKVSRKMLKVDELEWLDNISIKWLPANIDQQGDGSHNGEDYIAYTFYLENNGAEVESYWYEIYVDDVIKNVDEAIRVMIIRNGERTVYAKKSPRTGGPEADTEMFVSDTQICEVHRENFMPDDIDKFTIVIWIEGDDPECLDPLIGGMMKMHMDIIEARISPENSNETISATNAVLN